MKKKQKLISKYEKWEIVSKPIGKNLAVGTEEVIKMLLKNRGIKTEMQKKEYFTPKPPEKLDIKKLGIMQEMLKKSVARILKAIKRREKAIIFGDYDVDGISSSAILWEFLYGLGLDVTPYIPERFSEGYGIKEESIVSLRKKYPDLSLIIAVDNGIVAFDAIEKAVSLGIDTIVVDHHEKGEKYPSAYSIIHTTKLSGAAISWILVNEIYKKSKSENYFIDGYLKLPDRVQIDNLLELAVLGTVADQMPLIGVNRSFVKCGLEKLNATKRVGLNALFDVAGVQKGGIGIYAINYMIAPRLNAMGRLEHAIDSLRLLCTKGKERALTLAEHLNNTNLRRQKVVDEVLLKAKKIMIKKKLEQLIILDDESYHEGVIGLAASKLVDEFWRPAIVISKGKKISKGSARSIPGFSIINAVRSESKLILGGGGHEMAAGFSIETVKIPAFKEGLKKYALKWLKEDLLEKRTKIDASVKFEDLSESLIVGIKNMEPFGIGNPSPVFFTGDCEVIDVRKVGTSGNHLKFRLRSEGVTLDAILFSSINNISVFFLGMRLDVIYSLEKNYWNGLVSLQLKIKDLKYANEQQ